MELVGKINGILAGIDKNAEILGAGFELFRRKDQLVTEIGKIAQGHIHAPDMNAFGANLMNEPDFKTGLAGAIGGYIVENLDLDPRVSRLGSIVRKVSTSMALVTIMENLLGYSTNPGYPGTYKNTGNGTSGAIGPRGYS